MGKRKVRRQFSADFKRKVVAQTGTVGTSVSAVARRHHINANTVHRWRDDPRYAAAVELCWGQLNGYLKNARIISCASVLPEAILSRSPNIHFTPKCRSHRF